MRYTFDYLRHINIMLDRHRQTDLWLGTYGKVDGVNNKLNIRFMDKITVHFQCQQEWLPRLSATVCHCEAKTIGC